MLYNQALNIMDKNGITATFSNIKNLSYIKLIFKCFHNKTTSGLCKLIKRQDNTNRITRSSAGWNCRINFWKTTQGQRSFSAEGSKLWNLLPNEHKTIP